MYFRQRTALAPGFLRTRSVEIPIPSVEVEERLRTWRGSFCAVVRCSTAQAHGNTVFAVSCFGTREAAERFIAEQAAMNIARFGVDVTPSEWLETSRRSSGGTFTPSYGGVTRRFWRVSNMLHYGRVYAPLSAEASQADEAAWESYLATKAAEVAAAKAAAEAAEAEANATDAEAEAARNESEEHSVSEPGPDPRVDEDAYECDCAHARALSDALLKRAQKRAELPVTSQKRICAMTRIGRFLDEVRRPEAILAEARHLRKRARYEHDVAAERLLLELIRRVITSMVLTSSARRWAVAYAARRYNVWEFDV